MAETKLLPCPFCSGDARSIHRVNTNVVTCTKCGASVSQSAMGEGDADDIWNTRPHASRIAELEKALRRLVNIDMEFTGEPNADADIYASAERQANLALGGQVND